MIAPIRHTDPETAEVRRRLRLARQVVVSTLLDPQPKKTDGPPIPAWQAWLFAGWTVAVVAIYFASMLGWF
jgi:hypothetical protein